MWILELFRRPVEHILRPGFLLAVCTVCIIAAIVVYSGDRRPGTGGFVAGLMVFAAAALIAAVLRAGASRDAP